MIPCLNKSSLKLLVGTADERYDNSPEYFRNTHFPQIMHRYHGNQLTAEITEDELFEDLLEEDSKGNRVFFLFGSTGSGKSELLCWIRDMWVQRNVSRPIIRISRSELNPQVLIKRCFDELNIPLDFEIDEDRWSLLLQKPITLINQIVWTALAEIMHSDEEIVPLALLIRPIIEKNVTEFTLQVQRGRINKSLEILYKSQFDHLMSSTSLTLPLEYYSFRQTLLGKLDKFLFEGRDIGSLFKQLSLYLKTHNIRPLLLIDDLVQSVNIYATELLDQIITLEEGNWDVVIGLTPGAVQETEKGYELTQRIQNLDTIHDRVKKLWLSDESGKYFYNLHRNQVIPYMANYLKQLKGSSGYICSNECSNYMNCLSTVQAINDNEPIDNDVNINLLPFNGEMLKRTYDAIPLGKGKLRYMLLNSKEIIRFILDGKRDHVSRITPLVKREKFADHSDLFIKTISEYYALESKTSSTVPKMLLNHFGYDLDDISVILHSLRSELTSNVSVKDYEVMMESNDELTIVRNWIEGEKVNEELLEPVRLGVATLVHDVTKGVNMSRSFTPRTGSIIQRKEIVNRTRYPITMDNNVINVNSINIQRGLSTLRVTNFHTLKYKEKTRLFEIISDDLETSSWVYQSENLHEIWSGNLENVLGINLESFAFNLKSWVSTYVSIDRSAWTSGIASTSPFNQELRGLAEEWFYDWLLLRDNMVDPVRLNDISVIDFDDWLSKYSPSQELESYQIGEASLYTFLTKLKGEYLVYRSKLDHSLNSSLERRIPMLPYLINSNNDVYGEIASQINHLNQKTSYKLIDYVTYSKLDDEFEAQKIVDGYTLSNSLYNEVILLSKHYSSLCGKVKLCMVELGVKDIVEPQISNICWAYLSKKKESFTQLVEEITLVDRCLSNLPTDIAVFLIESSVVSIEIEHAKRLWDKLIWLINRIFSQQPVGHEVQSFIKEWNKVDFRLLKDQIVALNLRNSEKLIVMKCLKADMNCNEVFEIHELLERIKQNDILRPAVKRQLKLLIENGQTTLPPIQWKGLLAELKENFPNLFEVVEIRLVVSNK